MSNSFFKDLSLRLSEVKKYKKKTVFTISTTAKQEDNSYIAQIRESADFVLTGCIIFSQKILSKLLKIVDGQVDIILVDSEKKLPLCIYDFQRGGLEKTVGYIETGSVSRICFESIKNSKVFEFKPNDLTVNATWTFLSHRLKFLSGKRISILGAGNIGSKLALKLVECGAEVHLYRRDSYKGYQIINGLNLIKPESVIASVQFHQSAIQASFMSDVLIGATSGYPIIDKNIINSVKKGCLVVDLGKNNLTKEATQYAAEQSVEIYRTDVTHSLVSYIYEVLKMEDILKNSYGKIDLGFCNIVGGGFFGNFGDVVVDNVNYPKQVIGISQGDGTLKSDLDDQDISVIKQLNMKYKIGK